MWERACSRKRSVRRYGCRLTRPLREQARSHRDLAVPFSRGETMTLSTLGDAQDFHVFLDAYRRQYPDDVLTVRQSLSAGRDVPALVEALANQGHDPLLICEKVGTFGVPVATNLFASRTRIARMFGVAPAQLHETFQQRANNPNAPRNVESGPVLDEIYEGEAVDLALLPMLKHFASDRGPYITNAIIIAEDPVSCIANMSYHRSMRHARQALATSLHSRGHLWRMLQTARERGEELRVAMVVGAHPLFMLAAAARLPFGSDERAVAGGWVGAPPGQGRVGGGRARRSLPRTPAPGATAPGRGDERKAQGPLPRRHRRALPEFG